jgi:hypothetical protein
MNTYNVTLSYEDRTGSTEAKTIKVDASNIAGAIGKATREFVKSLDRKQRFDMNKGLKIEAARGTSEKSEAQGAAAEAGG